jgi:hypothetical protein
VECRVNGNCSAVEFCDIDYTDDGRCCFCDDATGKDTCEQLGTCKKLPCAICQECLNTMRDPQNITTGTYNPTTVFTAQCPIQLAAAPAVTAFAPATAATACSNIQSKYFNTISKCTLT